MPFIKNTYDTSKNMRIYDKCIPCRFATKLQKSFFSDDDEFIIFCSSSLVRRRLKNHESHISTMGSLEKIFSICLYVFYLIHGRNSYQITTELGTQVDPIKRNDKFEDGLYISYKCEMTFLKN